MPQLIPFGVPQRKRVPAPPGWDTIFAEFMNEKRQIQLPSESNLFAGVLVAIALVAAFLYGVAGADKFLLLSPLVVLGYATLSIWLLKTAFSRQSLSVSPPGFFLFLLFVGYGSAIAMTSAIPH